MVACIRSVNQTTTQATFLIEDGTGTSNDLFLEISQRFSFSRFLVSLILLNVLLEDIGQIDCRMWIESGDASGEVDPRIAALEYV